ncbi:MAG TPA: A/G-specific adenine glycosylase [Candidatus Saccharimonadia bacterium]
MLAGTTTFSIPEFQAFIWDYYRQNQRKMPWRDQPTPYHVVVSEIMLQQTQVARVMQKYPEFIAAFPDFHRLAAARTSEILSLWQGLGYNRRALNLHRLAALVVRHYDGKLPADPAELILFPGIGSGTAGSIAVFAFNRPEVFIETNIRRVFIHHFFPDAAQVSDAELRPLVEVSIDQANPREWYYGLMDYGAHIAKTVSNPNRRSRHYVQQSKFEGSDRQIRGKLIRLLLEFPVLTAADIVGHFPYEPQRRVIRLLEQLTKEGFLRQQ